MKSLKYNLLALAVLALAVTPSFAKLDSRLQYGGGPIQ